MSYVRLTEKELLEEAMLALSRNQNADLALYLCIVSSANAYDSNLNKSDLIKAKALLERVWLDLDNSVSVQKISDNLFAYMNNKKVDWDYIENLNYDTVFEIMTNWDDDICYY